MTAKVEKVSEEELAEYKEAFQLYEKDEEGFITTKELSKMLRSFGQNPTESELQDMIVLYDQDGNGKIDLQEFCEMMIIMKKITHAEEELLLAFRIFDKTCSGNITKEELHEVLPNLGESFTEEYVAEIFREVDTDGDGLISYEEFSMLMK